VILRALDDVHNKVVKNAAHLAKSADARERAGQTILEGPHLVWEALEAGVRLRAVLYSTRLMQRPDGQELYRRVSGGATRTVYVTDRVLDHVTMVENHQGVVAVAEVDVPVRTELTDGPVLLADGVQDPGNLGTLMRTAAAFGFSMALGPGTVDPRNPKVLRASAGLFFRLRPVRLAPEWRLHPDLVLAITDPGQGQAYRSWSWPRQMVLAVGNEGSGVGLAVRERASVALAVPMEKGVESLNVAAAAAILMAEAYARWHIRG
jgi:TrmH family RNA methyltransferase